MSSLTVRSLKFSLNKLLTAKLEPLPKTAALKKKLSNVSQTALRSNNYSTLHKKHSIQSNVAEALKESQENS